MKVILIILAVAYLLALPQTIWMTVQFHKHPEVTGYVSKLPVPILFIAIWIVMPIFIIQNLKNEKRN